MAECGCGRSPTGKCVGWHIRPKRRAWVAYQEKKAAYEAKQAAKSAGFCGLARSLNSWVALNGRN